MSHDQRRPDHDPRDRQRNEVEYYYEPLEEGGVNCEPCALGYRFKSCLVLDGREGTTEEVPVPYKIEYWSVHDIVDFKINRRGIRN